MSQAQYLGHGAGTGGLQRHSIGDEYPYTVVAVMHHADAPVRWLAMDTRTGNVSREFATHKEASIEIASLKIRNMMHS